MLQEVLGQELTAIEEESMECGEEEEKAAAGIGCRNSSCAGSCSGMDENAQD